ncbi:MAG: hypothetical protein RDV48_27865 [Candidatus Eremiobacteraeota bacterium]|nr:hypothetical protein [Candidatus Eremiobacteraeota bacterium]
MKQVIVIVLIVAVLAGIYLLVREPAGRFIEMAKFPNARPGYEKLLFELDRERKYEKRTVSFDAVPKRSGKVLLLTMKEQLLTTVPEDYFRLPAEVKSPSVEKPDTVVFVRLEHVCFEEHPYPPIPSSRDKRASYVLRLYSFDRASSKFLGASEVASFESDSTGNPVIGKEKGGPPYPDLVPVITKMPLTKGGTE